MSDHDLCSVCLWILIVASGIALRRFFDWLEDRPRRIRRPN